MTASWRPGWLQDRRRFSLSFLLGFTAVCAALLGMWKAFIYEPPTHKILGYEKAPFTRGWAMQVGANRVRILSVARNDRYGNVVVETGDGSALERTVPQHDDLVASASWLDVAQVELAPGTDRLEIIEARIFDHATRTLISERDDAFGWQVVKPNLVQMYGLGKELPSLLDVWLRVHSYRAEDRAVTLLPVAGSEATIGGGTITLEAIQKGYAGWSSKSGLFPVGDDDYDAGETALALAWTASRPDQQRFQVTIVTVNGDKYFSDQLVVFDGRAFRQSMFHFDVPLEQVQHIELRPHGGRHRFFFEAVQLPAGRGGTFASPPTVTLPIEDFTAAVPTTVSGMAPLRFRVEVSPGVWARGSKSNGLRSSIIRKEPEDLNSMFTLMYDLKGLAGVPIAVRFRDAATGTWLPDGAFAPRSHHQASGAVNQISARTYLAPLETIEAVELSVSAPR